MRVGRSLTIKQMATVSGISVVTICIFIVIQLFHFVQQRRVDYAQQMENIAHTVRHPLSQAVLRADIPQAEFILNSLRPAGILARAEVMLPDGLQALHTDFAPEKPVPGFIATLFELPVQITVPLYSPEPTSSKPLALLVLRADSWRVYQFIRSAISTMMTTYLLLALILSVAISWSINRLIVRPVRNIARDLQNLTPQEAITHQLILPHYHRNDEIGLLIRHYNRNQRVLGKLHDKIPPPSMTGLPDPALAGRMQEITQYDGILQGLKQQKFALWLKPQVDMRNGQLVGAKALLRMQQPDGSWCLADGFIASTQETGAIMHLWHWVFEESCRILAGWQQQGIALSLSVNLPASQLRDPALINHLQQQICTHQLIPGNLVLELTETSQLGEPEQALRLLQALQQTGVVMVLDDFGISYANLSRLQQFKTLPIRKLKLDRSFVAALPDNDTMVKIVAAITELIDIDVIAEGVETETQRDLLLALGIYIGQGYLYSAALPASRFQQRYFASL